MEVQLPFSSETSAVSEFEKMADEAYVTKEESLSSILPP